MIIKKTQTVTQIVRGSRRDNFAVPIVAIHFSVLLLLIAIVALTWPVFSHYKVDVVPFSDSMINLDRGAPSDSDLTTVANASMMTDHPLSGAAAVSAADQILVGKLVLPSLPVLDIDVNFSPRDLELGVPVQQLWLASLIVPDLLLRAYEYAPDPRYLAAAKRYIERFYLYDARLLLPSGFIWNAHAVSNRVAILARYWKFVRASETVDLRAARLIHQYAMRLGALLAKPEMFVATSNHGVMQNVALIQLSIAFPALPDVSLYRKTALERLKKQLPFYISNEGVVLEHSAGYHFHGVVLTGFLQRLLQIAGEPVPLQLMAAHESAREFLNELQRTDRSLPLVGNTYRYAWHLPESLGQDDEQWAARQKSLENSFRLYPVSGYAIRSGVNSESGRRTQAVVPWGYFAGHAHQRAQEMSLLIWSDGTDWSTNTGYWPADDLSGVSISNGWDGGNAPHVMGESAAEERKTALLGYAQSEALYLLDLERSVSPGTSIRRQIIQIGAETWIVIDSYADSAHRPLRVIWTAAPETEVTELGMHKYRFQRIDGDAGLSLDLQGVDGISGNTLRGSREPFGGWVAHDRRAYPAPSVDARINSSSGGWMAAVLQLLPKQALNDAAKVKRFDAPEDWELAVSQNNRQLQITRRGKEIFIKQGVEPAASTRHLLLQSGPDIAGERAVIARADAEIRTAYPQVKLLETERWWSLLVMSTTWIVMIVSGCFICHRWRRIDQVMWISAHVLWSAGATWLLFFCLRP